jgi:NAD+ dependent glucose-6-phosphate dehydrogenase
MTPKLLITGSQGLIGNILWQSMADEFDIYGMDACLDKSTDRLFRADISNFEQVQAAFEQIHPLSYVIHLAADARPNGDWQSILMNNIVGTRNIYEMALRSRVKRVIFASSNHVTGAYEGSPPSLHTKPHPGLITPRDPIRPDGYYGVSKVTGEALARMYYDLYGLESICLRIGSVLKDDNPFGAAHNESIWLSHRDLVQLVKKSLQAEIKFAIYYGVSNNEKRFWDISNVVEEIGYQPEDGA